jgi:hypothetical protein
MRGLTLALIASVAVLAFTVHRAVTTIRRRPIDGLTHALVRAHGHAHEIVLDWGANMKIDLAFALLIGIVRFGRPTAIGLDIAGELASVFPVRL